MKVVEGPRAQQAASESDQALRNLLRRVRDQGWHTPEGAALGKHLTAVCQATARRWRAAAGTLDLDGLSEL